MLFQIFYDVRINYTLCFIGKSIFCSYYFSVFILSACKGNIFFLHVQEYDEVFWKKNRSVGGFSSGVFRYMGTITLRFSFGVPSELLRYSFGEVPMRFR